MTRTAHIDLPGGRQLDFEIRPSARARNLRLKMSVRDGLTVIAPKGLSNRQVVELVVGKREWIAARLKQSTRCGICWSKRKPHVRQAFDLPCLRNPGGWSTGKRRRRP